MFGNLDKKQIEELLNNQVIGRLGCHYGGVTYVVPISYAYDGEYVYGHSLEGMKLDMMRKNPQVCFEVDDTTDLANWKSVVAWGEFEELEEGKERDKALTILNNRMLPMISSEKMRISPQWPFPSDDNSKIPGIAFRIQIKEKTGRFERSGEKFYYAT